jgi:hypothetical protein
LYVSILQHTNLLQTSAYARIRQHKSAYKFSPERVAFPLARQPVMRQHASAYVSKKKTERVAFPLARQIGVSKARLLLDSNAACRIRHVC